MPDAVVVSDAAGRVVYMNARAEQVTGGQGLLQSVQPIQHADAAMYEAKREGTGVASYRV